MNLALATLLAVLAGFGPTTPATPESDWRDCVRSAVGTDASYFACDAAYTETTGLTTTPSM